MGLKASNVIIGILIVAGLVLVIGNIYNAFEQTYTQIPSNSTNPIKEIGAQNLTQSVNKTVIGMETVLAPEDTGDILGGLKAVALGGLETIKTVFLAPVSILEIANNYLHIDNGGIIAIIGIIMAVLLGFIIFNLKTGGDN